MEVFKTVLEVIRGIAYTVTIILLLVLFIFFVRNGVDWLDVQGHEVYILSADGTTLYYTKREHTEPQFIITDQEKTILYQVSAREILESYNNGTLVVIPDKEVDTNDAKTRKERRSGE